MILDRSRAERLDLAGFLADHDVPGSTFLGTRLAGTRVVATGSSGDGPHEVRGPVADLLLVATGRAEGLAGLTGSGVERAGAAL